MSTTGGMTRLYIGRWNETDYVYALTLDNAIASVKEHFAFGNPSEDDYAVGEAWASEDNDSGWKVVSREVDLPSIKVEIKTTSQGETGHVIWSCPVCGETYSDDWLPNDELPVLLMCGCNEKSKFLLGVCKV